MVPPRCSFRGSRIAKAGVSARVSLIRCRRVWRTPSSDANAFPPIPTVDATIGAIILVLPCALVIYLLW